MVTEGTADKRTGVHGSTPWHNTDSTYFNVGASTGTPLEEENYNHKLYEFGVIDKYVSDAEFDAIVDGLKAKYYAPLGLPLNTSDYDIWIYKLNDTAAYLTRIYMYSDDVSTTANKMEYETLHAPNVGSEIQLFSDPDWLTYYSWSGPYGTDLDENQSGEPIFKLRPSGPIGSISLWYSRPRTAFDVRIAFVNRGTGVEMQSWKTSGLSAMAGEPDIYSASGGTIEGLFNYGTGPALFNTSDYDGTAFTVANNADTHILGLRFNADSTTSSDESVSSTQGVVTSFETIQDGNGNNVPSSLVNSGTMYVYATAR